MSNDTMFYTVKKGDTLSGIAQRNGTPSQQLQKINGIQNSDSIDEGQVIALKAEAVCKVDVQLLDHERNPIKNAKMRLDYCGKSEQLYSGDSGRVPSIFTDSPEDTVKILITRMDGTWKQITEITSDWGNKLVTLVSPKVKIETKTMPHPKDAAGMPISEPKGTDNKPVNPPENPETTEAKGKPHGDYGDGKGPKTEKTTTENGLPLKKVTNDQVKLDFLEGYTGEKITEEDYVDAAKELKIEVEVIKTIAIKESKSAAFDSKKRPTILYERHWFSRFTDRKYDKTNPDISSKKAYTSRIKDKKGKKISEDDKYGKSGTFQYQRLAKAYSLNKEAALKSCSWGKFQIMGFNYKTCDYSSVEDLVAMMCESEKKQINAVVKFIKRNCLVAAQKKQWKDIAIAYNGKNYKINNYDTELEKIYDGLVVKRGEK